MFIENFCAVQVVQEKGQGRKAGVSLGSSMKILQKVLKFTS